MTFAPDFRTECDMPQDFNDLAEADRARILNERVRLLHIYPQGQWHDDVKVVGNRNALQVMRDAIDAALRDGNAKTSAMVSDGECFSLIVEVEDHEWQHPAWTTRQTPYADPIANGRPDPTFRVMELEQLLRKANAELVKRGVRPITPPQS